MEQNVGRIDAGIRWLIAAVFFGASLLFNESQAFALLAAMAALVMVATALTRTCPLYRLFGLNTCPGHPAPHGAAGHAGGRI